jgi:hypothetical protein
MATTALFYTIPLLLILGHCLASGKSWFLQTQEIQTIGLKSKHPHCVTLGKLLNFSELVSSTVTMGLNKTMHAACSVESQALFTY